MESKHRETFCGYFMDQKTPDGPEQHLGVPRGGTTDQGAPGPPGVPWWVVPPSGHPKLLLWPTGCLLVHKKSTKSFAVFGLRLIFISCDVKNTQKTTADTGHWVNRLVLKMI